MDPLGGSSLLSDVRLILRAGWDFGVRSSRCSGNVSDGFPKLVESSSQS